MANNTSQHILSTSANLLGFCLFVITSLHISNYSKESILDELTTIIALLLILSCLISFYSIRTSDLNKERRLEVTAEYLFISAILGIITIIIFMAINIIK